MPSFSAVRDAYAGETDIAIPLQDELHFSPPPSVSVKPSAETEDPFADRIQGILEKREAEARAFQQEVAPAQPDRAAALANLPRSMPRAPFEAWLNRMRLLQPGLADLVQRRLAQTPSDSTTWKKLNYFVGLPPNAGRDLALAQDVRKDPEGNLILSNSRARDVEDNYSEKMGEVGPGIKALTRPVEPKEQAILDRLQQVSPASGPEGEKRLAALRFLELNDKASHFRLMDALTKAPANHPRLKRFTDGINRLDWRDVEGLQSLMDSCTASYFRGGFVRNIEHFDRPISPRETLSLRHLAPADSKLPIRQSVEDIFKLVRRVEDMDPTTYDKLLTALHRLPPAHLVLRQAAETLEDTASLSPDGDMALARRIITAGSEF